MTTETEQHWAGPDGDAYHQRSPGDVAANERFFEHTLQTIEPRSVFEFGCGTGANLEAIQNTRSAGHLGDVKPLMLGGFDIHEGAAATARAKGFAIAHASLEQWHRRQAPHATFDLVLTKGFLIHLQPGMLPMAYTAIDDTAGRYVLLAEYYNPTPQEIVYRAKVGRMWRRDFAAEFMAWTGNWNVIRYGFWWRHDPRGRQDDLTWFLLERTTKGER